MRRVWYNKKYSGYLLPHIDFIVRQKRRGDGVYKIARLLFESGIRTKWTPNDDMEYQIRSMAGIMSAQIFKTRDLPRESIKYLHQSEKKKHLNNEFEHYIANSMSAVKLIGPNDPR